MLVQLAIGVPAGILAAVRHNSALDRSVTVVAISGAAIPTFFLGILLILLFAVRLRWLPSGGYVPLTEDPRRHLEGMLLPAFALGFSAAGLLARLVRSSMLDVLREDYVRTAWAKGLAQRSVILRHALRNALIPVITVITLSLPFLFSGAIATETVFSYPGMGQLFVTSIFVLDIPLVMAFLLIITSLIILSNILADVLYAVADPRIHYS